MVELLSWTSDQDYIDYVFYFPVSLSYFLKAVVTTNSVSECVCACVCVCLKKESGERKQKMKKRKWRREMEERREQWRRERGEKCKRGAETGWQSAVVTLNLPGGQRPLKMGVCAALSVTQHIGRKGFLRFICTRRNLKGTKRIHHACLRRTPASFYSVLLSLQPGNAVLSYLAPCWRLYVRG